MMVSLILLGSLVIFEQVLCQDIAFPVDNNEDTTPIWQMGTTERPKPVSDPVKCPGNQLYYPGNPWFCDCGPRYIYYKPKNECYQAYKKGPCLDREHLVVRNRNVECVRNPCSEGSVRFNGRCYGLEKSNGPCEKINGTTAILKVNPDTLVVECTITTADILTLFSFPDRCPPGSKRDASNKCRENWNV